MNAGCMMETVLSLLRTLENRMVVAPPVDNLKTTGLMLEMFPDGSGTVYAHAKTVREDDTDDEATARAAVTEITPIMEFHNVAHLHGGLVSATCSARRA